MTEAFAATLVPTILAGGSGTRLWPVSRAAFPKHLVELFGEESLLQTTVRRALGVAPAERVITVAAAGPGGADPPPVPGDRPARCRTICCWSLRPATRRPPWRWRRCMREAGSGAETILWVCPSDHLMLDIEALTRRCAPAVAAAAQGWLVTFGITPSRAETGFGWIAPAEPLPGTPERAARQIDSSRSRTASSPRSLLATGTHLWNSGMFVFQAGRMLAELERWAPDILAATRAACTDLTAPSADRCGRPTRGSARSRSTRR